MVRASGLRRARPRSSEALPANSVPKGPFWSATAGARWVALNWALETPEEVGGVVSVSGATMPWGRAVDVLEGFGVTRVTASYYMSHLSRRADRGVVEAFVARAFWPQTVPDGYLDYVGVPLSLRGSAIRANSEYLGQTHAALAAMSKRYSTLNIPVEIVHGERDWLLTVPRHVSGFAEGLPNVRVDVASGVGHMRHHARPDLLQVSVVGFLVQLSSWAKRGSGSSGWFDYAADLR